MPKKAFFTIAVAALLWAPYAQAWTQSDLTGCWFKSFKAGGAVTDMTKMEGLFLCWQPDGFIHAIGYSRGDVVEVDYDKKITLKGSRNVKGVRCLASFLNGGQSLLLENCRVKNLDGRWVPGCEIKSPVNKHCKR